MECQISLQWERTLGLCLKLFGFGLKGFEELDGAIANPVKCNFVLSSHDQLRQRLLKGLQAGLQLLDYCLYCLRTVLLKMLVLCGKSVWL